MSNDTIDLEVITLNRGGHGSPDEGHCLLEVVSMFAGEAFSDAPSCVDPVLRSFGISWNDGMRTDAERAQLKQYIVRLVGTNKGSELSKKRSFMALDWLIRVHAAAWLTLSPGLAHHAEALKALPPITCTADLTAAQLKLNKAQKDAAAAWDAAGAAAGAAAWAAAWDAAGDATRAATRAAAGDAAGAAALDAAGAAAWAATRAAAGAAAWAAALDAAGAAAWDATRGATRGAARDAAGDATRAAAGDAAGAAAWAKIEPTVLALQASAHELFSKMIDAE